jgi:hypothetical protein
MKANSQKRVASSGDSPSDLSQRHPLYGPPLAANFHTDCVTSANARAIFPCRQIARLATLKFRGCWVESSDARSRGPLTGYRNPVTTYRVVTLRGGIPLRTTKKGGSSRWHSHVSHGSAASELTGRMHSVAAPPQGANASAMKREMWLPTVSTWQFITSSPGNLLAERVADTRKSPGRMDLSEFKKWVKAPFCLSGVLSASKGRNSEALPPERDNPRRFGLPTTFVRPLTDAVDKRRRSVIEAR